MHGFMGKVAFSKQWSQLGMVLLLREHLAMIGHPNRRCGATGI